MFHYRLMVRMRGLVVVRRMNASYNAAQNCMLRFARDSQHPFMACIVIQC